MKETFSMHYSDMKIGFYKQFSDNIVKQRDERNVFFKKINEILNNIHLKCEISFISDENDFIFFIQNESIVLE